MSQQPIFQSVFGDDWNRIPNVIRTHYGLRPGSGETIRVTGTMDVDYRLAFLPLIPIFRLLHIMVPYKGTAIPVNITMTDSPSRKALYLERYFTIPGRRKPYRFDSAMTPIGNGEILDVMTLGICARMRYAYENGKVVIHHRRFGWNIGKIFIPLPIEWLIGRVHLIKEALSDDSFRLSATVTHPFFGETYRYQGKFTILNI